MENKLSGRGAQRIKSPLLYPSTSPRKQAPAAPSLNPRSVDRSTYRSNPPVAPDSSALAPRCTCGALRAAVRVVQRQRLVVFGMQGPGCAVHGWKVVRP